MDYDSVLEDEFDALFVELIGHKDASSSSSSTTAVSKTKYPAKQHARRVAKELGVEDGLIYLTGQVERLLEDSDQPRFFRQRRYFFYLSGANFEDCTVTYEIGRDRLTLWIPYIEPRQVLWFGSKPSAAECLRRYDVDEVRYSTQLSKFIDKHASSPSPSTLFILHPDQAPDLGGKGGNKSRLHFDHAALLPAMDRARVVKTEYEVAMIRRANDISSSAHRAVAERILSLSNERQIEAIFQAVCTANGARSQAYPIIAASGINGSTLHYSDNDAPLEDERSVVVLDAGCELECYASDITRTLPLSGSFTGQASAIHTIVQRMQDECISLVRPGKSWNEIHLHAASIAMDGLLSLGILKGDRNQLLDAGIVAAFFPHGLGHHVGLEVHDVSGTLPLATSTQGTSLDCGKRAMVSPAQLAQMACPTATAATTANERKRQRLQENMVVTVEPGIYFCREYLEGFFRSDPTHAPLIDWDVLESYYHVGGVRIEDCILVTQHGYENLTTAPKGDELLDLINKRRK